MGEDFWDAVAQFAIEKSEGFKQSTVAKTIGGAIAGRKLPLPAGLAAGAAGSEVSLPGFYTLSSYLGVAYGARHYLIGPRPVIAAAPAFVVRTARFLFGPIAVGATVIGVGVRKYLYPPSDGESPFVTIPFALLTGGLENQPLFPDVQQILQGSFFRLYAYGHQHALNWQAITNLIPVWTADP